MNNLPHKNLPKNIADFLFTNKKQEKVGEKVKKTWDQITPFAKNEWICFLISAKTEKGKLQRLERAKDQLAKGQKRPCCWAGCQHRKTLK